MYPQAKQARVKKGIPKVLKDHVWTRWVGDDVARTACLCCGLNEIKMNHFHCGHVVAEAMGGATSVENLRPICAPCNLSMGTQSMDAFRVKCGFQGRVEPKSNATCEAPVRWVPHMFRVAGGLIVYPKTVIYELDDSLSEMIFELSMTGRYRHDEANHCWRRVL